MRAASRQRNVHLWSSTWQRRDQEQTQGGRIGEDSRGALAYDAGMNTNGARIPMPSAGRLAAQNAENAISGTAGTLRRLGFSHAFLDFGTMRIHPSRFADGTPAPYHCLDGLPDEAVLLRMPTGRVVHAKVLVYGFERGGFFYTQTAAARACEQWDAASTRPERRSPPEC